VGASEKLPFFRFCDEEIAAILLLPITVSTWNLVIKQDVVNVECEITVNGNGLSGIAKWDDILKPREVDIFNVYRLLPKVTEAH